MFHNQPPPPHHHKRAYLFLITLIVGALLVVLVVKDDGSVNPLTGSSIGIAGEEKEESISMDTIAKTKTSNKGKVMDFSLSFDNAPHIQEETQIKELIFTFKDPTSSIKINAEELELKNLEEIKIIIINFDGKVDFDETVLSLQGKGESITINGMEISTKGKMDLSFSNLVYETMKISEIALSSLDFGEGSGSLSAGEKMDYVLSYDQLLVTGFEGDFSVGMDNQSLVTTKGQITGLSIRGEVDLMIG
ncbi:MAG: hypothetical protein ABIA37_00715 [Candidatus Woesearchaeota archaeon]